MPRIYTYFTPEEFGHFGHRFDRVFVIDILRATTTMVTAIVNGVKAVYPVLSVEDVHRKKEAIGHLEKNAKVLTAGERKGEKLPGVDMGNSPLEYRKSFGGAYLVMTTSNGTRALAKAKNFSEVHILSNLNLRASLDAVRGGENIALLCSGSHAEFSLEDALTAGIFIRGAERNGEWDYNDQSLAAKALAASLSDELFPESGRYRDYIAKGIHARRLIALGAEKDIEYASEFNKFDVVCGMRGERIERIYP